ASIVSTGGLVLTAFVVLVVGVDTALPARSVTLPLSVTSTCWPSVGAVPTVSTIWEAVVVVQSVWLTGVAALLTFTEKSEAVTVEHSTGSLNVVLTSLLPERAKIELNVGTVVSTEIVRVSVADGWLVVSMARNENWWLPSG